MRPSLIRAFNTVGTDIKSCLGSISTTQPWSLRIRFWVSTCPVWPHTGVLIMAYPPTLVDTKYIFPLPLLTPRDPGHTFFPTESTSINIVNTHSFNSFLSHTVQHKLELLSTAMDCLYAKVIPMITDCAYNLALATFIPAKPVKG